jgi:hypothetical protein
MPTLNPWSAAACGQAHAAGIAMTDEGLVIGHEARLVRMRKTALGRPELALDTDRDRLVAMMSVARNRPVLEEEVLPHVQAAARHWRGGDKALANLRLIFSPFAKGFDPDAAYRLSLAGQLLDAGWAPNALLVELGLASSFSKYDPQEPRVPAYTRHGGEWTFGPAAASSPARGGRFDVAIEGGPPEDEKAYEFRVLQGVETIGEDIAHGHPIRPPSGGGVGPGPFAGRSIPAGPSKRPSLIQQEQINQIGRETGCHTYGTKDPGIPGGKFVGDHQPATALIPEGTPQRYFPHCLSCSLRQGGLVSALKRGFGKERP